MSDCLVCRKRPRNGRWSSPGKGHKTFWEALALVMLVVFVFLLAGIRWALAGNWLQALYWLSGASINIAATFMKS